MPIFTDKHLSRSFKNLKTINITTNLKQTRIMKLLKCLYCAKICTDYIYCVCVVYFLLKFLRTCCLKIVELLFDSHAAFSFNLCSSRMSDDRTLAYEVGKYICFCIIEEVDNHKRSVFAFDPCFRLVHHPNVTGVRTERIAYDC